MGLIYEPKGRAREYAPLALNVYRGCAHKCIYCFGPRALHITKDDFSNPIHRPGDFLMKLSEEAEKRQSKGLGGNVLLSFTTDPYQPIEIIYKVTRQSIEILHNTGHTVTVLTKGGTRALRDLDMFGPGDAFATTLTFLDPEKSHWWEPEAATPSNRIQAIQQFSAAGIMTWVSLEPVIEPSVSLELIKVVAPWVGAFKVGTLNHHPLAKEINWWSFANEAIQRLEHLGYERQWEPDKLTRGQYYIKADLARWLE